MNFLGHLYFSPKDKEIRVGNVLGDFFKGRLDKLTLPKGIIAGLALHRRLDRLTDECQSFRAIKSQLNPKYAHYRGIIADIFIDHFLAIHWTTLNGELLTEFSKRTYAELAEFSHIFPDDFKTMFYYIQRDNLLVENQNSDMILRLLRYFDKKSKRFMGIEQAIEDLETHYEAFESYFFDFIKEMKGKLNGDNSY